MSENTSPYREYLDKPDALVGFLVEKDSLISEKDHEIAKLQRMLHNLQKAQFGRKSEKFSVLSDNQLLLLESEEVAAPETPGSAPIVVPAHTRSARIKRDLSKLPHHTIEVNPESTTCRCCSKELSRIGEDVSLELEHQPARLFVNKYVRPRFACSSCKDGVLQAPLPESAKPLDRSIAGAGLLSHVLVSKYVDHLPLHRQQQMFARLGFEIPRKNLCEWTGAVVDQYLEPLWVLLKKEALAGDYLQGDETTLKIQDREVEGKCHLGYLWGMLSPEKGIVVFEYAASRAGEVAKDIFSDLKGALQTDAYAGYNPVYLPEKVARLACLAHVRRKFIDAGKSCSKESDAVLRLIAELYHLEKNWQGLAPPERLVQRKKKSLPVLKKLEEYLHALVTKTLPKAPLMEALKYTLNQWREIERIFEDGRFHLDNNMIEREMRPIAIGRKNYLFAGSHQGAKRAAIIYSLFATARLHKVNPQLWILHLLQNMRNYPINRLHELLPHRWGNKS